MGNYISLKINKNNNFLNKNIEFEKKIKNIEKSDYILSHDDDAQHRLNEQHWMIQHLFEQKNYYSPVNNLLNEGIKVLDSGCGTGTWCLTMCEQYPNSEFIGLDINDNKYPHEIKPLNCIFKKADINKPMEYNDDTFDFIHQRLMCAGIKKDKWPILIKELKRICKNGGWIEFIEMDIEPKKPGKIFEYLYPKIKNRLEEIGLQPDIAINLKSYLENEKLINIHVEKKKISVNHENSINEIFYRDLKGLLIEPKNIYMDIMDVNNDNEYIDKVDRILKESEKNNTYFEWYRVYGQVQKIE